MKNIGNIRKMIISIAASVCLLAGVCSCLPSVDDSSEISSGISSESIASELEVSLSEIVNESGTFINGFENNLAIDDKSGFSFFVKLHTAAMKNEDLRSELNSVDTLSDIYVSSSIEFFPDGRAVLTSEYTDLAVRIFEDSFPELGKNITEDCTYHIKPGTTFGELKMKDDSKRSFSFDPENMTIYLGYLFERESYTTDGKSTGEKVPEDWYDSDGTRFLDVRYGERERNTLDIYVPAGLDKTKNNGLIVFIYGGSWTSGDKSSAAPFCHRYIKEGYVTAAINFDHLTGTDVLIYTMVDQINEGIKKIKAESDKNGWNITQCAIGGASSGAHLAMLYAYSRNTVSELMDTSSPFPVRFVVNIVGPAGFQSKLWDFGTYDEATGQFFAGFGTGEELNQTKMSQEDIDRWIATISPISYASTAVPTVMAYGMKDTIVNPESGKYLSEEFEKAGIRYDLIEFPNSGHTMTGDPDLSYEFYKKTSEYAREYFNVQS